MQAPPFWMWMFRIVGVLCLITLITPTVYLLKYSLHDNPIEESIAKSRPVTESGLSAPAFIKGTDWYIASAEGTDNASLRALAVKRLGDLASSTKSQVAYPVECLHVKLALEQVASADPDPALRQEAKTTLMHVAEHGAVIER
jgi:hypothetical protein